MPLVFRTVKARQYVPPPHSENLGGDGQSFKGRMAFFSNQYVSSLDVSETNYINFVASCLVAAEKCIVNAGFLWVSVFEVEEGKGVELDTPCIALFKNAYWKPSTPETDLREENYASQWAPKGPSKVVRVKHEPYFMSAPTIDLEPPLGFINETDMFIGITVAFDTEVGDVRHNYYLSCLSRDDIYFTSSGNLRLQPKNSLEPSRMAVFKAYMNMITPVMGEYYLDKDGICRRGEKLTGDIHIKCATNFQSKRRAEMKKSKKVCDFYGVLYLGMEFMLTKYRTQEPFSKNHRHCLMWNNYTKLSLKDYVDYGGWLADWFKRCFRDENPPYPENSNPPYPYSSQLNGIKGLKSKGDVHKSFNETFDAYRDYWKDSLEGVTFDNPNWYYTEGEAYLVRDYGVVTGDAWRFYSDADAAYYGKPPYKWQNQIDEWIVRMRRNTNNYFSDWINCVRFISLVASIEKFVVPVDKENIVSFIDLSGVSYPPDTPYNILASTYYNSDIKIAAYNHNGLKDTYNTKVYNDILERPFEVWNPATFCPMPFDMTVPQEREPFIRFVTTEAPKEKQVPCKDSVKVRIQLLNGGSMEVDVNGGKNWLENNILSMYKNHNCQGTPPQNISKSITPTGTAKKTSPTGKK